MRVVKTIHERKSENSKWEGPVLRWQEDLDNDLLELKMKKRKENGKNGDKWAPFMKNAYVLREPCDQD
jgi:hypothetical protein